ncbi:MAG: hypothetical protein NTZ34_14340 [Chloroflexi bacterium]|nr:hypothetical protein [Chloroflexota bacterium]
MRKRLIPAITLITLLAVIFSSCAQQKKEILPSQMASTTRGDLILSVSSDGNLDMPNQVRLKFGTPGTVKDIPAEQYQRCPDLLRQPLSHFLLAGHRSPALRTGTGGNRLCQS